MNLHFIELPVLLKFNIVPAFHIVAGPSFSYLVGGKDKFDGEGTVFGIDIDAEGEQELDMDDFNSAGIVGTVGLGLDRKSVVQGKRGSVRVELGGRRTFKKTITDLTQM